MMQKCNLTVKLFGAVAGMLALTACEPLGTVATPTEPKLPDIEVVQATRKLDTVNVYMRYVDGSPIAENDKARAMARATQVACRPEEAPTPDFTRREDGLLRAQVFCTRVLVTDAVVDGGRFARG